MVSLEGRPPRIAVSGDCEGLGPHTPDQRFAAEPRQTRRRTIAIYRLSAQVISRSAGRSATAAAAYRAGVRLEDRRTGQLHDYERRSGVVHAEIMAPEQTPAWMLDRNALWNAVEIAEKRKDAQLSRECNWPCHTSWTRLRGWRWCGSTCAGPSSPTV